MVKANAYGLGVREVVACIDDLDPWGFGVATVDEGCELRAFGVTRPVLVCSPAPGDQLRDAVRRDLQLSISNLHGLTALAEAASHGKPICRYAPRARGAWAYLNLAKELLEHECEKTG